MFILIRSVPQLPLFGLIKSFESLKYLYEDLTYFKQYYKDLFGNFINTYVLQTVFFEARVFVLKKWLYKRVFFKSL